LPPPQKPAVPTTGGTTALNAVTGDPFLDGIIQNRLSHMSGTAQGFMNTANTIADVAVGMTNVGSAYEAIVGETITGQELTPFQRGVAGVSVAFAPLAFVARIGGNAVEGAAQAARLPEIPNRGSTVADINRAKSRAAGIPDHQIGPSGLPKIHSPDYATMKRAKDAAQARAGKGGTVMHHPSPAVGKPHFHGVTPNGVKCRIHDSYHG